MEFPHLGEQCSEPTCKKLDFLPVKCDACGNIYCMEHMSYVQHSCPSAHKKDVQVPICPLCGSPVPTPRNQSPDISVSEHIDRDCQSDPAKAKRKEKSDVSGEPKTEEECKAAMVNSNRCAVPGCKIKEMIPVICGECRKNFCLRHRFPDDHKCQGRRGKGKSLGATIHQQQTTPSHVLSVQGNMVRLTEKTLITDWLKRKKTEDEALAKAISESMKEASRPRREDVPSPCNPQRCLVS